MTAKKKLAKVDETKSEVIVAFKGFNAEFKCRGFQYAVGATYEHKGKVDVCNSGFHACKNPFDVLDYYTLLDENAKPNRFAEVRQSGETELHNEDRKIASASITITAELSIPEFVKRAVAWMLDCCKSGAISGDNVQSASGDSSKLAASGYSSKLAASGHSSQLAASGHSSQLAASGDYSQLAASGDYSQLAASGHSSKLAASGDSSKLAASGHSSQLAASGHSSKLAASGYSSKLAASGHSSKLAASGENSVIASSSYAANAKGAIGTWIALAEFDSDFKCIGFATGCIGNDGLEPDVYYRASGGKLVNA